MIHAPHLCDGVAHASAEANVADEVNRIRHAAMIEGVEWRQTVAFHAYCDMLRARRVLDETYAIWRAAMADQRAALMPARVA